MAAIQFVHVGIGLVLALILKQLVAYLRRGSNPLPPGPSGLPLLGNITQVPQHQPWLRYHQWGKEHGPIVYLNLGGQPVIVLNTLETALGLLSRRGAQYSDRARLVVAGEIGTRGLHILLRPYNRDYLLHQRMESPLLNPRAANTYRPLQDLESKQLLFDLLSAFDSNGAKGTDCNHWFERMTASTVYALLYGYRLRTGNERELVHAKYVQIEAIKNIQMGAHLVDLYPVLNYLPSFCAPWKKIGEALWQLERNLHVGNMKQGLANPGWNFTKAMKVSKEAKDMSTEELAFDLGILADAALDTTTMTLGWLIVAWLTEDKAFVLKAWKILDDVVGRDRLPQFEDMPRLTYIQAIVHEAMRWRPVVPGGVPHRYSGSKDDEYLGYRIPAGSLVIANHWGIGRDESVYGPNPDTFIPERWLCSEGDKESKTLNGIKDMYTPGFGFGRRVCTGQHIARNALFIAVARILWAFDVELATTESGEKVAIDPMANTEGFAVRPLPFNAVFRPRGPWVKGIIGGDTHDTDLAKILDQVAMDQSIKK
ncbi:hypothetical protein JX265_000455 [Neoarthrinium moseri]|uniref:Cytochrome P450 n=1 Tax=Neoarthrinium moseri TaxID=1658444 RepID=A0A9P9WYL2_9PEZI|nr:hypothetical protein JX265_000455 [Neoarthrinium moseri]